LINRHNKKRYKIWPKVFNVLYIVLSRKPHESFLLVRFKVKSNVYVIQEKLKNVIKDLIELVGGLAEETKSFLDSLKVTV
jgi:hypothetical protein